MSELQFFRKTDPKWRNPYVRKNCVSKILILGQPLDIYYLCCIFGVMERYEFQIKLSLMLFIFIFLLTDFITLYIIARARVNLTEEIKSRLFLTSKIMYQNISKADLNSISKSSISRRDYDKLQESISNSAFLSSVGNICIIDENKRIFLDSKHRNANRIEMYYESIEDSLVEKVINGENVFSKPYETRFGDVRLALFSPIGDRFISVVETSVGEVSLINRVSKIDFGLKIALLLAIFVFGVIFLTSMFKPLERMKHKASSLREKREEKDIDYVVHTFEESIEKLRKIAVEEAKKRENIEEFNKYILNSMASGVISVNNEGIVTCLNGAGCEILSVFEADAIGKRYDRIFDKKISGLISKSLQKKLEEKIYELDIKKKDGENRFLYVSPAVMEDVLGNRIGVSLIFSDMTELKKLQDEVILKERLASLGELSAGIAHQFKNSLSSILGYAKLLKKEVEPKYIHAITTECADLNLLVDEFLKFSKPLKLSTNKIDINKLIKETVKQFKDILKEKQIALKLNLGRFKKVDGDGVWLRQAFLNILNNSVEATEGGGSITVRTFKTSFDRISIEFTDTGRGIPKNNLKRIFDPFFTTKDEGIGLGLSIAHKIIAAHKGKIELKSKKGEGTKISIIIPQ